MMTEAKPLLNYQRDIVETLNCRGLTTIVHARRTGVTYALARGVAQLPKRWGAVAYVSASSDEVREFSDTVRAYGSLENRLELIVADDATCPRFSADPKLIIVDQAAHVSPAAMQRACSMAMWGATVIIAGTLPKDPRNHFTQHVRTTGDQKIVVTLDSALDAGLLDLIRQSAPHLVWRDRADWVANLRHLYGGDAAQDLDCIIPELPE